MVAQLATTGLGTAVKFLESQRAAYKKLDYTPVFRGSALFYAVSSSRIDTQITFMNYWREKNNVLNVGALVTLRNRDGERVNREYTRLQGSVYSFSCRAMAAADSEFEGSLEIEIFSDEDIKFPFSAINVFYVSDEAVSFVHANQRVFNNLEDLDLNVGLNPWQTGFDVLADDEYSGFVAIVNGPRAVSDAEARLLVINRQGEAMECGVPLGRLPAYGSRMIRIGGIDGVRQHLAGQSGWAKVDVELEGVFNRFLCGNISSDGARMMATHSFYDCAPHSDYFQQSEIPDGQYAVFLPFTIPTGVDLDIVFYPICSPALIEWSLELRDKFGRIEHSFDDIGVWESGGDRMTVIDIRQEFRKRGVEDVEGKLGTLVGRAAKGTDLIPMRINHGMNFRIGRIGCNISNGIQVNPAAGKGVRAYRWGPLLISEGSKTHLIVLNLDKQSEAETETSVQLTFWSQEGAMLKQQFPLRNGTAFIGVGEDILRDGGIDVAPLNGQYLWYTVEAGTPYVIAYEVHQSAAGYIGGDHSF